MTGPGKLFHGLRYFRRGEFHSVVVSPFCGVEGSGSAAASVSSGVSSSCLLTVSSPAGLPSVSPSTGVLLS